MIYGFCCDVGGGRSQSFCWRATKDGVLTRLVLSSWHAKHFAIEGALSLPTSIVIADGPIPAELAVPSLALERDVRSGHELYITFINLSDESRTLNGAIVTLAECLERVRAR